MKMLNCWTSTSLCMAEVDLALPQHIVSTQTMIYQLVVASLIASASAFAPSSFRASARAMGGKIDVAFFFFVVFALPQFVAMDNVPELSLALHLG